MIPALIQFTGSVIVIILAGTLLARFADKIAEETGLGRILVGSLFLAAATSLPEITVDFNAVAHGFPDIAVGDLFGSSLFNLLILMAVSAFFRLPDEPPERPQTHAAAASVSISLTALAAAGTVANLEISVLRAGLFSWLAFLGYIVGLWFLFRRQEGSRNLTEEKKNKNLAPLVAGYAACTGMLLLAAPYLVESANALATLTGLGQSFIGTTLVALSTSLPELVATIAAFRMGQPDLALGNIFGSNMFNMAIFLPLDWYYPGNLLRAAEDIHVVTALGIIFASGITTTALLTRRTSHRAVLAGNGAVVCSIIAVLWLLYHLKRAGV